MFETVYTKNHICDTKNVGGWKLSSKRSGWASIRVEYYPTRTQKEK